MFICEKCVYSTNSKQTFDYHLKTNRHKEIEQGKENLFIFLCSKCNKGYKSYQGLNKHNKTKCIIIKQKTKSSLNNINENSNLIEQMNKNIENVIVKLDELSKITTNTTSPEQPPQIKNPNYIYLLQEREFVKSNKPIYKLGKSKQENVSRIRQYPKGSVLYYQTICIDCDSKETELIRLFNEKYTKHPEIGNEYFEGDYNEMLNDIKISI
jgi:hypothetical protein